MGVSQILVERECWPLIEGTFMVGGEDFNIEGVANEEIFVCSFVEDTHVGIPIHENKNKYA